MKVIKLDNRHRLYKEGFTHAFRFNGFEKEYTAIENVFSRKYGYSWNNSKCWGTYWGKTSKNGSRVIWIGVRNESLVTQALLSVQ